MLKLILIFLIGIAYAAQTRIKIGSKSWGYQIDLNQGQQIRNEFSNEDGVTAGYYIFKIDNETKKLQYTIDVNRMEPDIEFDVIPLKNENNSSENGTVHTSSECSMPNSNMTFDSIDSNQDFKGHVTLKVGNASYSINFATGDKSNFREEVLTPSGLMYGRYNFMLKNSPHKIVINYKFNSSSSDPTFEVSLFKSSSDIETISSRDRDIINSINYNPSASYRVPYQRGSPYVTAGVPSSHSAALARAHEQSRQAPLNEKYRHQISQSSQSSSSNQNIPSWYYNRNKSHEP